MPTAWRKVPLGEFQRKGGGTPSTTNRKYWDGDIYWITSKNIDEDNRISYDKTITKEGLENSTTNLIPKGSVIMVTRVGLGKVAVNDRDVAINQDCQGIISNGSNSRFLMWQLKYISNQIKQKGQGTTISGITISKLNEIEINLPVDRKVQDDIVENIETQFTRLDAAIKSLKAIKAKLETYRQSVLKAAFKGINWQWVPFADCGKWTGGGTPSKFKKEFWNHGTVLWVSSKDMKVKDIIETEDKITREAVNQSSAKFIPKNSLLFVVRSGILRRILPTAIVRKEVTVNQDLQAFTPNEHNIDFLYWFSRARSQHILRTCSKSGTTVESIETSLLKKYEVPICPLKEQVGIVAEIESRFSVIDKVEETVNNALLKAEQLRKSILKAAFEGKLANYISEERC